jgi:hypothetical protein
MISGLYDTLTMYTLIHTLRRNPWNLIWVMPAKETVDTLCEPYPKDYGFVI